MQVVIPLSRKSGPLFQQVYRGLREAILAGTFSPGQKLPSTRELAEQLRISRTVVLMAYDQLLAEGFTSGRAGAGTYVSTAIRKPREARSEGKNSFHLSRFGLAASKAWSSVHLPSQAVRAIPYDFAVGTSDLEVFPFEGWRRMLLRSARKARTAQLDYGSASGSLALREAICAHLRRSRAVDCEAGQVIVVNGSQQALDLIARVLIDRGDTVAIEDPGYQGTREILRSAGARMVPIAVDSDGLDPAKLPRAARAAFVTPSHQFPSGAVLPLGRRVALLAWARRANALIVEDDYDGEFHYEGFPLESLQGLDREGRVLYIGTFSRTIYSALRIGYLIAPKALVPALSAAKWLCDRHTATLEQETLAEFIASGLYERYLRRVRRNNDSRRKVLLGAIEERLGDRVEVAGDAAGAHIVLWPRRRVVEEDVIRVAAERGVGIYGITPYFLRPPRRPGFLLGYSRLRERDIREGIRRLAELLGGSSERG